MSKTKKERELLLKRSYAQFVESDHKACLETIKKAITIDPHCYKSYYLLSLLYEDTAEEFSFLLLACYLRKNDINLWIKAYSLAKDNKLKIQILLQIYKITDSKTKREILYELLKLYTVTNDLLSIYKIQIKLLKFTGDDFHQLMNELILNVYKNRGNFQKSICINLLKEIFNYKLLINAQNYLNIVYLLFKSNLFHLLKKFKKYCSIKLKNTLYKEIIFLNRKILKKDYSYFDSEYTDLIFFYVDFLVANDKLNDALSVLNNLSERNLRILSQRFFYKQTVFKNPLLNNLIINCRSRNVSFDYLLKLRVSCILFTMKESSSMQIFSYLYSIDPYNNHLKKIIGKDICYSINDPYSLIKKFIRNSKKENINYLNNATEIEGEKSLYLLTNNNKLEKKENILKRRRERKLWGIESNDWLSLLYNFIIDTKDTKMIRQLFTSNNLYVLRREQIIFLALISIRISIQLNDFDLFLESFKKLNNNYHLINYFLSIKEFNFLDSRFYNAQRAIQKYLKTKYKDEISVDTELSELSTIYLSTFLPHYLFKETLEYLLSIYDKNVLMIPIYITMSMSRKIENKRELINKAFSTVTDDYNRGRIAQFVGLNGKAEECYKKVESKFSYFNLALIYKNNDNLLMYKKLTKKIKDMKVNE